MIIVGGVLLGCIALGVSYKVYNSEVNSIDVTYFDIENKKIPKEFDGFKIAQITDLHNKVFGNNNRYLLDKIEKESPDIVVITGDLIDGHNKDFQVALKLIDELIKKYKVYYIDGNHEQKSLLRKDKELFRIYFDELKKRDINYLKDESVKLKSGNKHINLYGFVVPFRHYNYSLGKTKESKFEFEKDYMDMSLDKSNTDEFNILLAHTPFFIDEYIKWGADLVFAGHIHGGMIRLPIAGGLLSPNREFFPKYDWGMYKIKNSTMILSKGLGGTKPLMRINCKPEIVLATLKSK